MKKFFSSAAVVLIVAFVAALFGGCDLFGSEDAAASTSDVTEESTEETLSDEWDETSTDILEEETTTTTTSAATTSTTSAATTTTAATQSTGTTVTTETNKPQTATESNTSATEPSTAFKANPSSNLKNQVISPLNSGYYTMSVVITDDESDEVIKYASGGKNAYVFKIPSAGYYVRIIKADGKPYMIAKTNTKSIYCELTNDDYSKLTAMMNGCFNYNFSNLSFQSSTYELYNTQFYTKEVFLRPDGLQTFLWFKNDALKYIEENAGSSAAAKVGVTVSNGADSSMFSLPEGYTLVPYDDMSSIQMAIEMFLQ